jgi:hypothetical protein
VLRFVATDHFQSHPNWGSYGRLHHPDLAGPMGCSWVIDTHARRLMRLVLPLMKGPSQDDSDGHKLLCSNSALVDEASKHAKCHQIFECHLLRPFINFVSRRIPDRKEARQSELQGSPLTAVHSRISRIAFETQARLSYFWRFVTERFLHQLVVRHVSPTQLRLRVCVDRASRCMDSSAEVLRLLVCV